MPLNMPLASVHFVWALGAISQLKRIPFAPELVAQQFPPPHSAATLLQAAAALGLKAQRQVRAANEIQSVPLPCVAVLRPSESSTEHPEETHAGQSQRDKESPHALAIVVKADDERIVMLEPGAASGATLSTADFNQRYAGELILLAPQAEPLRDADAAAGRKQAFGFSWFIPELLKHKKIWRDVLLASLAIQLVALTTPLFTQIVLDKVVAHQALNTLAVIGIALALFLVFNAGMSWIRQGLGQAISSACVARAKGTAPQDGTVKDLATHTLGSVVAPGTVVMTLVPGGEGLLAEVWVTHLDAGLVQAGQSAKLKLTAYPFQQYGLLSGRVKHISPDAREPADPKNAKTTGIQDQAASSFRALIELPEPFMQAEGKHYRLSPGMQVNAEIKLGTRTVLEYLLSPVQKTLHEAGREL